MPSILRSCLVAASLVLSAPVLVAPAFAQEPSPARLALARELIGITGAVASIDELLPGFTAEIRKQTITRPDIAKDLDAVIAGLQPEMQAQRQQAYESVAKIYAKFFTETELRDVVTFFKTPSGAKYIKSQPEVIDEIVDTIQIWAQHTSEYTIARVRSEMNKRGIQIQ